MQATYPVCKAHLGRRHDNRAVACARIERWIDATERGDQGAADNAAAALSTSREWSILQEMSDFGFYPEALL